MQSALDKRSARRWKETMLRDLDAATAGLIGGTDQDYDTRLAASRKIVELVDQLAREAAAADDICRRGTRRAVNSELEFFLFGGRGDSDDDEGAGDDDDDDDDDDDGNAGFNAGGKGEMRNNNNTARNTMRSSSAAMRAKTRGKGSSKSKSKPVDL